MKFERWETYEQTVARGETELEGKSVEQIKAIVHEELCNGMLVMLGNDAEDAQPKMIAAMEERTGCKVNILPGSPGTTEIDVRVSSGKSSVDFPIKMRFKV